MKIKTVPLLLLVLFCFSISPAWTTFSFPSTENSSLQYEGSFPLQNTTLIETRVQVPAMHKSEFFASKLEQENPSITTLCYAYGTETFTTVIQPDYRIKNYGETIMNTKCKTNPSQLFHRRIPKDGSLYYTYPYRIGYDPESWIRESYHTAVTIHPDTKIEVTDFTIQQNQDSYTASITLHWKEDMSSMELQHLRYSLFLKADHVYLYPVYQKCLGPFIQNVPLELLCFDHNDIQDYDSVGFPLLSSPSSLPLSGDSLTFTTSPFVLPYYQEYEANKQPNWSFHIVIHDDTNFEKNLYSWSFPLTKREGNFFQTRFPFHEQLLVEGRTREYYLYVPPYTDLTKPQALIIVLHGGGGNAFSTMDLTDWNWIARYNADVIIAYPEGIRKDMTKPPSFTTNPQSWNDGSNNEQSEASKQKPNDVLFIQTMIEDIQSKILIDQKHIHVTGFSNGGSMTFRVARELDSIIASVAPVASTDWFENTSQSSNPIPLLYITGTDDPLNPMEGGELWIGDQQYGTKPPIQDMILKWVERLQIPSSYKILYEDDDILLQQYKSPTDRRKIRMMFIKGLGHHWPMSSSPFLPEWLVGSTKNIDKYDAITEIWKFFRQHPKMEPIVPRS
ncbi:MAG: PHB depolymerase family esterase [Caldisericia bacterium]|nr:PHB depolymerase family esterase [Caldisericia bacterium]